MDVGHAAAYRCVPDINHRGGYIGFPDRGGVGDGIVIAASYLGKWKTVSQVLAVLMLILNMQYALWVLWLATALTILSGVDYYVRFRGNKGF